MDKNTTITLVISITPQQQERLPENIGYFLELAALERLGSILAANCITDTPHRVNLGPKEEEC